MIKLDNEINVMLYVNYLKSNGDICLIDIMSTCRVKGHVSKRAVKMLRMLATMCGNYLTIKKIKGQTYIGILGYDDINCNFKIKLFE